MLDFLGDDFDTIHRLVRFLADALELVFQLLQLVVAEAVDIHEMIARAINRANQFIKL